MKGPRPLSASPRSSAARRYSQARIIWVGLLTLAIVCCCAAALSLRKAQALNAVAPSPQETHAASARMGDVAGIRAAGRGGPAVRLADGRDVLADYEGEPSLVQALGQAEPLGLASADFDEDGVPDLVGGYANGANGTDGGGLVTLHRGNAGALYPNSPEAQRRSGGGDARVAAPFLSPARVFAAPARFDFIGAGDFDGDGHRDVVGAGLGRRSLYLLAGDGKGNLSAAREIALPGALTALTTGEMNRPDGLADVLVGVESGGRAQVLVFEGPRGALKASPETFRMPARVNSLALAQFDDGYESDLVAAAGDQLVLVRGRDRKLSVARLLDEPVPEAEVTRRSFSTAITSLAAGDFDGEPQTELALLFADGSVHVLRGGAAQVKEQGTSRRGIAGWRSEVVSEPGLWAGATRVLSAKVSSAKGDDLLLLDAAGRQVHILKGRRAGKSPVASLLGGNGVPGGEAASLALSDGGPVAVLPMQLNVDALTDLVVLREGHSAPAVVLTENYGEEGTNKPAARTPQVNFTTGARLD
ncbi:MAG: FG-GAP repeat domain-containing protein, partial [Pyrinomonadaceae bacterium]